MKHNITLAVPMTMPLAYTVSESAQGVDSLLPVQLDSDSEIYKSYLAAFYPRRASTRRGFTEAADTVENSRGRKVKPKRIDIVAEPRHYFELIEYMAVVSTYITGIFAALRYPLSDTFIRVDDLTVAINRELKFRIGQTDEAALLSIAKSFASVASSGKLHIILPSERFKGGFDIVYSGVPGTYPGTGSALTNSRSLEVNSVPYAPLLNAAGLTNDFGKDEKMFTTDYAKWALQKAKQIQQLLLGPSCPVGVNTQAHLRHNHQLPLNFDFKVQLNAILNDASTKKLLGKEDLDLSGFPELPTALQNSLGTYFSLLVNLEPEHHQVGFVYRSTPAVAADASKQPVSGEYLLLQPDITLSFVAHLPKEVAEYITQTPPGSQIPLVPLNTWASIWSQAIIRAPGTKSSGGSIPVNGIPRYILPASATFRLVDARKKLGFYTEEGRSNDDDMFVSNTGRLNYCPKAGDLALDNAMGYEKVLEEALNVSFAAGSPLNSNQVGETHKCFSLAYPDYGNKIRDIKSNLKKYAGSLQTFSWDYNCLLTSSASGEDKLISINLSGAVSPDDLGINEYLTKPFAESMALLFNTSQDADTKKLVTKNTFGGSGTAVPMLKSSLFNNFFNLYKYLFQKSLVPNLQDLITKSAKEMDYNSPLEIRNSEDGTSAIAYDVGIYSLIINSDMTLIGSYKATGNDARSSEQVIAGMLGMLSAALSDSYGAPRTNLAKVCQRSGEDVADDPHYFSPEHFTLAEFKNLYNYLGGRVFLNAMKAISGVSKKDLCIVDTAIEASIPNFSTIVKEVMPLVVILSRYVIDSEDIATRAGAMAESNRRDPSITVDDIHIAGSVPTIGDKTGFQMFPHQVEAHQYLRHPVPPKYAVLDVAPGGGKTTLLLADIACLVTDGHVKRPAVLAPNGLVRNWVEDMIKVTGGTWNIIPITTMTYRDWGDERLTDLINKAPRNTIVVVGFSATKLRPYPIVIGNHVETVSGTLEFLKKFGFDYLAIDESHKLKRASSLIHAAAKQLCVSSVCKYVRLATGTLISNKLTDVVGQAALFNPQIFRTAAEYEAENSEQLGDSRVTTWKKNTPQLARAQLSKQCAVVSFKRKEWAFMLPRPIETFIPVQLDKADDEGGAAHQLMYEAILKETLEEIKKDDSIKKLLAGKGDDDDGDENNDESTDDDLDDATLHELGEQLNPYLARLEQLLTDPLGDPFGEIYFKDVDVDKFVSNKVLKIIERIRLNFTDFPWQKGKSYKLKELADFDGLRYTLMGPVGEKLTLSTYDTPYVSTVPPNKDPRWQEESRGKVIVFCRFTRTVNAIFKHLPADLQKMAVKFHGEEKNKEANLNAFKSQPINKDKGVQILIANEQAMNEGHNLQMASRLIRVEAPWAPGDLDQAAARIFRPDPTRKFKRETIYLDWVLTNHTLEVSKMGRLISKIVTKTQFDESDNPLYASLQDVNLPLIKMSLKLLQEVPSLNSIGEYIEAYQGMAHMQAAEFEEMRQTKPSSMVTIESTPMFADAAIIENVPYVPNQEVVDRHNFGLIKLNEYLEDTSNPDSVELVSDKKRLVGRYVHTDMGNGVIVNVGLSGRDGREPGELRKITRVYCQLANGDLRDCDASLVYLATNLNESNVKEFTPTSPWATREDKVKASRLQRQVDRLTRDETRRAERAATREKANAARTTRSSTRAPRASRLPTTQDVAKPVVVNLYQTVFNGYLALQASPDDYEQTTLEDYGYKTFGDYAYITIPTATAFDAVLDYLEAKFEFSADSVRHLNTLANTFKTRGKRNFAPELAPLTEFKNFYTLRHRASTIDKATGKPQIKMYPVVMEGSLMLNVDINTNPAIRKVLNKTIPGCTTKFDQADGLYIKFFKTKSDLVKHVKQMRADGVVISNYTDLIAEVKAMNFKQGMR